MGPNRSPAIGPKRRNALLDIEKGGSSPWMKEEVTRALTRVQLLDGGFDNSRSQTAACGRQTTYVGPSAPRDTARNRMPAVLEAVSGPCPRG